MATKVAEFKVEIDKEKRLKSKLAHKNRTKILAQRSKSRLDDWMSE